MKNFNLAAKRVVTELRELASISSDENGAQRLAWTATWRKSREWFIKKAKEANAKIEIDAAGNIWAKIEGKSSEGILVGSHIDCVANGGWLDGCLGVVVTLEILRQLGVPGNQPEKTFYAVDWADEEGARFGRSLLGVSAACGTLDINEVKGLKDNEENELEAVLQENGVDLNTILRAHEQFKTRNISAAVELHIEQGPVLEAMKKDVACVYGITGVERHYVCFYGQAAHAGSFPTEMREDAFLAAAQAALEFKKIALKYNGVCTVGKVKVAPNSVTIVPNFCELSLDQRSIDKNILKQMHGEAKMAVKQACADHRVISEWKKIWTIDPTIFNDKLIELCKASVKEETGDDTTLFSGPLHDSAEIAKLVPTVMMFAMSEKGLSHCKEENTSDERLETAIRAFLRLVDKVVNT